MDAMRDDHMVLKKAGTELSPKWYAVYTRPRFEKQVGQRLLEEGIEAYVPLIKTMRQWSDRKKVVELPL